MGSTSILRTSIIDRIGTITLDRPDRRNALDPPLIAALDDAVKHFADDPVVRVIVLTGAPAPGASGGFCAGGDLKATADHSVPRSSASELGVPSDALDGDLRRHDRHTAMLLHLAPKPTVAMIGGPAIGAGLSLAAACDLRMASTDAVFAAGFASNGLSGDYGGTFFWTQILGTAATRRLYLLDERIDATTALTLGMVHEVFPPEDLEAETMAIARRLAGLPGPVAGRLKSNLNEACFAADRRRWLFANEAVNQRASSAAIAARRRLVEEDN